MTGRIVFTQSMEALYRALQPPTPPEHAAFLADGVTGARFAAGYPVAQHIAILDACAQSRFAHLPELERYTEVGKLFFEGFSKTLMGSALMAMLKLLQSGCRVAGATELTVTVIETKDLATTFEVKWAP